MNSNYNTEYINSLSTLFNRLTKKSVRDYAFQTQKIKFPIDEKSHQMRCKNKIDVFYTTNPETKKDIIINRKSGAERYAQFLEEFSNGEITDKLLKDFGKKWSEQNSIITIKNKGEKPFSFLGMKKGNERYNKLYNHKTIDLCGTLAEGDFEVVAMTLTYDIKKHGANRFCAWKNYPQHIKNWLENLRKHHGAVYVRVTESTKKGYPHTHIVVGFPKGTIDNYELMGNRCKITSGWLYDYSKSFVDSKVFNLEKISGKNTKFYLSKYISKTSNEDLQKICNKKGSLTQSEQKAILGLMGTVITDTRIVSYSQPKAIAKRDEAMCEKCQKLLKRWIVELPQKEHSEEFKKFLNVPKSDGKYYDYDFIMSDEFTKERADEFRNLLITLCNNSPCDCTRDLYITKRPKYEYIMNRNFNGHEELSNTELQALESLEKNYGCKGCFFAAFSRLITTGYDECFDFWRWDENNLPVSMFDPEHTRDNVTFCRELARVCTFLSQKMYVEHTPFYRTTAERVRFINKKKI